MVVHLSSCGADSSHAAAVTQVPSHCRACLAFPCSAPAQRKPSPGTKPHALAEAASEPRPLFLRRTCCTVHRIVHRIVHVHSECVCA